MKQNNRERILEASIELFNRSGTVAITTNHIAKHLRISPGNLYFYFRNREDIVRELFKRLCLEVYAAWEPAPDSTPHAFLERSAEVFWKYRFFHREMYHLRRQDPRLARAWKRHLLLCSNLWKRNYRAWAAAGYVRPIADRREMRALSESVLLQSSAALGFFESAEKTASRRSLRAAVAGADRLLSPYYLKNAH